jgi:hypothetical protein
MRTTIKLDADVSAAIEQLRKSSGRGVSETVNGLIRRGLVVRNARPRFIQRSQQLGLRIDVANVAEAIDFIEGAGSH